MTNYDAVVTQQNKDKENSRKTWNFAVQVCCSIITATTKYWLVLLFLYWILYKTKLRQKAYHKFEIHLWPKIARLYEPTSQKAHSNNFCTIRSVQRKLLTDSTLALVSSTLTVHLILKGEKIVQPDLILVFLNSLICICHWNCTSSSFSLCDSRT